MSGAAPWPTEIRVRPDRRSLRILYDDGAAFEVSASLLRAMTPSAQDRGHGGPSFEPLPGVSPDLELVSVVPVGRYALRLEFSDGHASGLYDWARLRRVGEERDALEARLG